MDNSARKTLNCSLCVEERNALLNTFIDETIDMDIVFKSLAKDTHESGIYKVFVPQNFINVTCEDPVIRFSNTVMPPIALTSYPGSGNTWYRELIERISGIATAAKLCGLPGLKDSFIGNCGKNISRTIMRKVHLENKLREYEKAVLIIRNPYDAILAEFNRRVAGKVDVASSELFHTKNWTRFVDMCARGWLWQIQLWLLNFDRPLLISFYENMVTKFYRELFRVAKFLGVKVTFKDLWCAKTKSEGNFHRIKPKWLSVSTVFPEDSKKSVERAIDNFRYCFKSKYESVEIPF